MKTTPAKFVERLRIEAARRRLEESQNSMEAIAENAALERQFDAERFSARA